MEGFLRSASENEGDDKGNLVVPMPRYVATVAMGTPN